MSKKVITIHGINTRGQWQESIKAVLEPHFECISIKYDEYRWFGETKILLDPFVFMAGLAASVYLGRGAVSLSVCILASFLIAVFVSYLRRLRTMQRIKRDLDGHLATGKSLHVIAHSLGTYFIGRIIEQFPDVRLDYLILAGCVLKRATPWSEYLRNNPRVVRRVRNEMAVQDLVAKLAVVFYGLFPGLGYAGVAGFKELSHDVDTHSGCGIECTALVHNVRLPKSGHSDVFVGRGHAQRFWLPFLWGLDPSDYEDFMEMCLLADELDRLEDARLGAVEDELRLQNSSRRQRQR
jgi:hypothetical protein